MPKIDKKFVLFIAVLITLAAFFRFYNLSNLLYWMFDEERDAFVVKRILVDHHFTLIGGSIPGAFYLGPGYFYISSIFYFLSRGDPIGPAIAASTLGVISTLLVFLVAREMFGRKTAVFSALFYAVSYLIVSYNRTWWPLTFAPTVSLISYISLYKIIKNKKIIWAVPLSLALIVGAHSDPSNFSLILLALVFWIFYKLPVRNKFTLLGIFLFLFSHISLVVFDLRHDFFNTKLILKMFSFGNSQGGLHLISAIKGLILFPQTFARVIYASKNPDMALQIVPFPYYLELKTKAIPQAVLLFSVFALLWFLAKYLQSLFKKENLGFKIIGTHLTVAFFGIFLYNLLFPNYTYEWFLQVLFPAFAIIIGLFATYLYRVKILRGIIWVVLFAYLSISLFVILHAKNSYAFGYKREAVKWSLEQVGYQPFSLDAISSSFSYGGYRYLYYLYGHEPVKSYMDPVFIDWMYPRSQIAKEHPEKVIVIVNRDLFPDANFERIYQKYLSKTLTRKSFGAVEILIIDNKEKWVDW